MADTSEGGAIPRPDPTERTTEGLQREIAALKELVFERIDRQEDVCTEKFASVRTTLNLIESQRVEQKKDTKDAVDAALAAAKEAVGEQTNASEKAIDKSEAATTKGIEQLGDKLDSVETGLRRELGDQKERITTVEQQKVGGREVRDRQSITTGQVIAVVSAGVALFGVFAAAAIAALT